MLTIRPYCFKEGEPGYSTSPAVLSISAAIEGRNKAIHVSAGECYFGDKCSFAGDMMLYGKLTTPSSRVLEIDAPVSTRGVNTRFVTASGSVPERFIMSSRLPVVSLLRTVRLSLPTAGR